LFILDEDVIVFPAHFDKDIESGKVLSSTIGEIKKKSDLMRLKRQDFIDKVSSMVMPTPPNYKEIIGINTGSKPMPTVTEVYELEIGPNRYSIST
jgi:hypothetical protein